MINWPTNHGNGQKTELFTTFSNQSEVDQHLSTGETAQINRGRTVENIYRDVKHNPRPLSVRDLLEKRNEL